MALRGSGLTRDVINFYLSSYSVISQEMSNFSKEDSRNIAYTTLSKFKMHALNFCIQDIVLLGWL